MMAQNSLLSRVEPFFVFLGSIPSTIREGLAEVVDTISPSKKRRRSSTTSIYQHHHPSPDAAPHPQQKRLRLSDASASNAAGPSVPTPAAFRSAHDLLTAATSPTHPNPQIITRDAIQTHPPPPPFPATPCRPSLPAPNHSSRSRPQPTISPSDLDLQKVFQYPVPGRRSSFNGLRDIWPRANDPSATIRPRQNRAELYWQRVEQRSRARPANSYNSSAVNSPRPSLPSNSYTHYAPQPHIPSQSAIREKRHPIASLTTQSPTLRRTRITPAPASVPRRAGIQKWRPYNDARLRRTYQGTMQKMASAAEISMRRSQESKSVGSPNGFSEKGPVNLAKGTIPMPFVEILEGDSILCQKLFMKHGPAMKRLVQSQNRSQHRQLECWLAEQNLTEMKRKRKEARRLNAIESQIWKQADHRLQQPPKDDDFMYLEYWNEEDSDWNENTDNVALAERRKQITVTDEKAAFAPLSESALRRLRAALNDHSNQHETLSKIEGCIITGEDLRRLNPNCWLNDEIVNAYMALISARTERLRTQSPPSSSFSSSTAPKVKIMSSFFYTKLVQFNRKLGRYEYNYSRVRRWTRRFDVFSFDFLLIPINEQNVHWTLGVVDIRNCKVEHLDSMGTGGSPSVREFLMRWVRNEAEDKQKSLDPSKWKSVERRVPIQENTDDCGVFLCKYADFISRGWTKFTFSQRHMHYFRARIAHELLMGKA